MGRRHDFAARLGIRWPIIQAPMAGAGSPELVAAVCNAGGLGSIAAAYLTPAQIEEQIAAVRRLTERPFAVNLFAAGPSGDEVDTGPMLEVLGRWHGELGIDPPVLPGPPADAFAAQLQPILAAKVPVFSFTLGIPSTDALGELRRRGVYVMGTATTVAEARALEAAGVDAVVAQGSEAGGHRGTFAPPFAAGMIGTMALVPQVADAVALPVVAAGGLMDGRGVAAAWALGAAAVQVGTAFITSAESGAPASYRAALLAGREDQVVVTRAFSGRPARGLRNRFIAEVEDGNVPIPPFPLQNALTRPMRTAAARADVADALSLWCGQGIRMARQESAGALLARLVAESDAILRELHDG